MALATIFGGAGAMLVLVGLIGGGFSFSGSVMPKVGGFSRILCFGIGGLLLALSLGLVVTDQVAGPANVAHADPSTGSPVSESPSAPAPETTAPSSSIGYVMVGDGFSARVFEAPDTTSAVVTELSNDVPVEILCTVQGESVTSELTGVTSSLWNGTTDGGFIPDVYVDTGTDQPVQPNCMG